MLIGLIKTAQRSDVSALTRGLCRVRLRAWTAGAQETENDTVPRRFAEAAAPSAEAAAVWLAACPAARPGGTPTRKINSMR
jgi:hypothetical protein